MKTETSIKAENSQDGGGNNAYKIITSRVEERNIPKTISYVELFMSTMQMKNNFCNGRQPVRNAKNRGWRRENA